VGNAAGGGVGAAGGSGRCDSVCADWVVISSSCMLGVAVPAIMAKFSVSDYFGIYLTFETT
jgi:hypothetical protein